MHTTKPVGSDPQDEGGAKELNRAEEGRYASEGDTSFADHIDRTRSWFVEKVSHEDC